MLLLLFVASMTNAQKPYIGKLTLQALNAIENNHYLEIVDLDTIALETFKSISDSSTLEGTMQRLLQRINDPSIYFQHISEFNAMISKYGGAPHIGIGLIEMLNLNYNLKSRQLEILTPLYGTPIYNVGIQPRDELLGINGKSLENSSIQEVSKMLVCEKGDTVNLLIGRGGKLLNYSVIADTVKPYVYPFYQIIKYKRKKLGIIWLPQMSEGSAFRVLEILGQMKKDGVKGIILDVRQNPGGHLKEAQMLAGLFLGEKPMAFTQSRNSAVKMIASTGQKQCDLPMVVLTNAATVGAAEALAGTLQHHKRAKIIGADTYGRGLIYSVFVLDDEYVLTLPVANLKSLSRVELATNGIAPDQYFISESVFKLRKSYKKDDLLKFAVKELYSMTKN